MNNTKLSYAQCNNLITNSACYGNGFCFYSWNTENSIVEYLKSSYLSTHFSVKMKTCIHNMYFMICDFHRIEQVSYNDNYHLKSEFHASLTIMVWRINQINTGLNFLSATDVLYKLLTLKSFKYSYVNFFDENLMYTM